MFKRISALCIAATLSALLGAQAVASPSYSARGLSWSDGLESNLSGINQLGQTIGTSYGGNDASVPASESVQLVSSLSRLGASARVLVTSAISHADRQPLWRVLPEVPKLANAFGAYFASLEGNS